jgi:hypothetical protein
MTMSRRELLASAGGLAASAIVVPSLPGIPATGPFPARDAFAIPAGMHYLNSAYIHPMSRASAAAV